MLPFEEPADDLSASVADLEGPYWDPAHTPLLTPAPSAPPDARPFAPSVAPAEAARSRKALTSAPTSTATPTSPTAAAARADLRTTDVIEVHVTRADPWRRAAAWLVDGGPFVAAGALLAEWLGHQAAGVAAAGADPAALAALVERERAIALSVAAVAALALAVYATLAHALAGATLGKRLLGIRVVGPEGRRPSPGRSALRSAVAGISLAILGLGFLVALFSRTGRALHDVAAGTWVVKAP